jgi:hypothetical protein
VRKIPDSSQSLVEKMIHYQNTAWNLGNTFVRFKPVHSYRAKLHQTEDNSSSDRQFPIFTREVVKFHPLLYLHPYSQLHNSSAVFIRLPDCMNLHSGSGKFNFIAESYPTQQ